MKTIAIVLLGFTFSLCAGAQQSSPKGIHPVALANKVVPAEKPVLLHTGKGITAQDKSQLFSTVIKAHNSLSHAFTRSVTNGNTSGTSKSITLTPDLQYVNGVAYFFIQNPATVFMQESTISFGTGYGSHLEVNVNVNPNTAYMLVFTVTNSADNQSYTVSTGGYEQLLNPETVTGSSSRFVPTEFAYSFVADKSGLTSIILYSNAGWIINSVEITPNPL